MAKKIKLLHITSSLKVGGAEQVLCDLIAHLGFEKYEHQVIYFHTGPHVERLKKLGVPVHQITGFVGCYDPIFFYRVVRLTNMIAPDAIHSLLWLGNFVARVAGRLCKIPVVCAIHNNLDQNGWLRNYLDRWTMASATRVVCVSQGVADSIESVGISLKRNRPIIIPNGIDRKWLHQKATQSLVQREDIGLSSEHWVIGSVGRLHPVKNYPLLLAAFSFVYQKEPAARLVIVGTGPELEPLQRLVSLYDLTSSVVFIIDQPAVGYYQLFDCFVLASDKEGVSIALLEAMSFSLPCVVTAVDEGHPVISNQKNGIIVPAGNNALLAQALLRLAGERERAHLLSDAAVRLIKEQFDVKTMVRAYERVFKEL